MCAIMLFPVAMLFTYYADAVVTVLFTAEYSAAVPVFATFALLLYLDCFDFHLPLRVQNANRYFVAGSIIALCVNLGLLYPLYLVFGLIGPAIALVAGKLALTGFLARKSAQLYKIGLREMVRWEDVIKVFAISIICAPILVAGKYLVDDLLIRGVVFGAMYLAVCLLALRLAGVWDAYGMARALLDSGKSRLARKGL
jgi:O-antigen/teichoic acid export membrane protein